MAISGSATKYAAYQVANNAYLLAKAAYEIIPPPEQNPIIIALRTELNNLNQQLDSFRQQLSTTTQRSGAIIDAVQQGAIAIESASFDTTLRSLIDTRKVSMRVTLVLLGERRTFTPGWDFNLTVRDNLKPVIDQILRERGII